MRQCKVACGSRALQSRETGRQRNYSLQAKLFREQNENQEQEKMRKKGTQRMLQNPENDRFENDDFTSEEALTDRIGVLYIVLATVL
jgi:protein required for attachment to host cells